MLYNLIFNCKLFTTLKITAHDNRFGLYSRPGMPNTQLMARFLWPVDTNINGQFIEKNNYYFVSQLC